MISVLGPIEVRRAGELRVIPAGKPSELLVRLAVEAGASVRSDRLVEDLWDTVAAQTSRNTLQSKVARLRRALGDPAAVEHVGDGYRLAVDPSQVDAVAALDAATAAKNLLDAGDDQAAAELCASVLTRFNGDLLPAAGDAEWVAPHRSRLEATHQQLVETWCSARLRRGGAGDAVADLELALARHPYHEGLWVLLVTALYQAGRQADALAAYQRVRARLADDLGLEPGPRLRQLEQQVLVQDAALAGPGAAPAVPAGNLPSLALTLVGRETESATLVELVRQHRLVEVVGPGGVGKTALAIDVARQISAPGGVWLVRLEAAATPIEVVDATVAALGATAESALVERLRVAPALLVLDNCEHVLDAAAEWVARLLDAAPGVRILCTSQAPLDLLGSTVFELAPLDLEHAVELFSARAAAPRAIDGDAGQAVLDLCRSLDGLPLAIELAAARTRTLSLAEISRRLGDRFAVLSDPASRKPERRRALRATIGWSYDLLFPDDQRGLWALATFAGGASLAAAESVLAALDVPATATIDIIGRLAVRSLVIVDTDEAGPRYRLLDSIRAFALGALAEAGASERAYAAQARWLATVAGSSTDGVRSAAQAEHLAVARAERSNTDSALAWCAAHDPPAGLAIAIGFAWAWVVLGDSRGAARLASALGAAGDAVDPPDRATALLLIGWIEASTGHLEPARAHVLAATDLAASIGDVELQARCCYYLAYVVSHEGSFREGLALTDRSRDLLAGLDRPWDQAANALFRARAAISAGDEERSIEATADVLRWLSVVDDPWLRVRGEAVQGELARLQHRFDDAVAHLRLAAATSGRLGFLQTEAYQLATLGRALAQAGDDAAGAGMLQRSIAQAEAIGDVRMAALARVHLGRVLRALGRSAEARTALELTTAWHRAAGGGEQALLGECLLAALDAAGGDAAAEDRLRTILATARTKGDAPVEVFALDGLARAGATAGDGATARSRLAEADQRMAAASHFISERDRVDAHAARSILAKV